MTMVTTHDIARQEGPVLSPRYRSKVHVISRASTARIVRQRRSNTRHTLLFVWVSVGMLPLLFQIKSYWKFVSPHKLTETLVTPVDAVKETNDLAAICPVEGLFIAGAWWNLAVTHYFSLEQNHICHFVIPQYNIHGSYVLGDKRVPRSSTTPSSCADDSFSFDYYFYHGSISYYAFYEEGAGTYCTIDKTAYVRVRGLGTFDSNGSALAKDRGATEYRYSLWYSFIGFMWMVYRVFLLRRSYVSCKYYGQKYNKLGETLSRKAAAVYMQESVRLVPYNATNYVRIVVLYMLIEGVMSDLFLLIAQDGLFAKTQYISLGYNLSGVMSMIFELLESMKCLPEKSRLVVKRLLFSYETCLVGELLSAAVMNQYLTWINRSDLRDSRPVALAVSYYLWSLVGHGILVLGLIAFITFIRILLAFGYMLCIHRSWKVVMAPCSVDTILGIRNKMTMLGGYVWQNHQLFYNCEALKAFGIMRLVEEDGAEYFVVHRITSIRARGKELAVIGSVRGSYVESCGERQCNGRLSLFDKHLGGAASRSQQSLVSNKVLPSSTPSSSRLITCSSIHVSRNHSRRTGGGEQGTVSIPSTKCLL